MAHVKNLMVKIGCPRLKVEKEEEHFMNMKNDKELKEVLKQLKSACAKIEAMIGERDPEDTNTEPTLMTRNELKAEISEILKELGVPANLMGYDYLRYAIMVTYVDSNLMKNITADLYPMVAREFNTTTPSAERVLRHAVLTAFKRGDKEVFAKYFGNTIVASKGRVTVGHFIATIVDYLTFKDVY